MNVLPVECAAMAKRDVWTSSDWRLCVRPGMRQIYTPPSGTHIVAAWSVRNDFADEVLHYVVVSDGVGTLRFLILDENFATFQDFRLSVDVEPRIVTHVVVEGQILICSPDFPTLWGLVGSGLVVATKVASANTTTTAIDVPRGIACRFCNRAAVANGRVLYFTDPVAPTGGDLRTFVVENTNGRDGVIYGIHEGAGGSLVCVTSQGTHALSTDAAAVQIVGSNGTPWQILSHHSAYAYRATAAYRGRVWALSRRGIVQCDVEEGDEVYLSDPVMPRAFGARAHEDDYRACRMSETDDGPAVVSDNLQLFARYDVERELVSWWTNADINNSNVRGDVVGTLHDVDGTEIFACTNGAYRVVGDFDGASDLASPYDPVSGVLAARVETQPAENATVRHIDAAAQCDGQNRIDVALRGKAAGGVPLVDPNGLIVGTSTWGATATWQPTPIVGMQGQFGEDDAQASRDVCIEVRAQGYGARFADSVTVATSDSAPARPQNVGVRA